MPAVFNKCNEWDGYISLHLFHSSCLQWRLTYTVQTEPLDFESSVCTVVIRCILNAVIYPLIHLIIKFQSFIGPFEFRIPKYSPSPFSKKPSPVPSLSGKNEFLDEKCRKLEKTRSIWVIIPWRVVGPPLSENLRQISAGSPLLKGSQRVYAVSRSSFDRPVLRRTGRPSAGSGRTHWRPPGERRKTVYLTENPDEP